MKKTLTLAFLLLAPLFLVQAQDLFTAVETGTAEAINSAIKAGAKPNEAVSKKAGEGEYVKLTPLMYAVILQKPDAVLELLRNKANPNAKTSVKNATYSGCYADISNQTALHFAAQKGNVEIIKLLIRAKANTQAYMTINFLDKKCRLERVEAGGTVAYQITQGPQSCAEANNHQEAYLTIRKAKGAAWSKEKIK
jgi:hypothetical protein